MHSHRFVFQISGLGSRTHFIMGDSETEEKKPQCKYGTTCYRKNPDHLKRFSHPIEERPKKNFPIFDRTDRKRADELDDSSTVDSTNQAGTGPSVPAKQPRASFQAPEEVEEEVSTNGASSEEASESLDQQSSSDADYVDTTCLGRYHQRKRFIENVFMFEMPKDFYAIWKLTKKLQSTKPCDAFSCFDITLCGPFDVLAGQFDGLQKLKQSDCLVHFRYPLDPPEFQTVFRCKHLHVGYLRDEVRSEPIVCSNINDNSGWSKLTVLGDNLFAALHSIMSGWLKANPDRGKHGSVEAAVISEIESEAKSGDFSLSSSSDKVKERKKKIVATTLHGAGIVVPVHDDVGYRELPETNADLKKMIANIGQCKDEDLRKSKMEKIQEMITYVQFANDECDYGMGLELGLDLFCSGFDCFHPQIRQLLKVAYTLLDREAFWQILEAHLQDRFSVKDAAV